MWCPAAPTTVDLHDRALMGYVLFTGALHWPHTTTDNRCFSHFQTAPVIRPS